MSKPLRLTFEAQPTTSRNAALFRQAKTAIYAVKQAQKELLDVDSPSDLDFNHNPGEVITDQAVPIGSQRSAVTARSWTAPARAIHTTQNLTGRSSTLNNR